MRPQGPVSQKDNFAAGILSARRVPLGKVAFRIHQYWEWIARRCAAKSSASTT